MLMQIADQLPGQGLALLFDKPYTEAMLTPALALIAVPGGRWLPYGSDA